MKFIAQEDFDEFVLELIQVEEEDKKENSYLLNLQVGGIHYSVNPPDHNTLYAEENYTAITVSSRPACKVCGEEDADHQLESHEYVYQGGLDTTKLAVKPISDLYPDQQFTIHLDCLDVFRSRVRSLLDENSDVIVAINL